MAIKTIEKRLPIIGKIRLGVRKKSQGGKEYPSETPYFVCDEVPEVKEVYGEEPKELDIYFPTDDEHKVIPNWFKWYAGGVKGKDGNIIGGKLQCYGDGEVAYHLAHRDPVTRVVPERQCLAQECPDWSKGGVQQCKPSMSVIFILPRVSMLGFYQIDTTSWNAIRIFVSQIDAIKRSYGRISGIPFKIYREETPTSFVDKDGKEQRRVHHIMKIKPNEKFTELYGAEVEQKVARLQGGFKMEERQLIEAPMEDNWPVQGGNAITTDSGEVLEAPNPVDEMKAIAEDPDLAPLFSELCVAMGTNNTPQKRLLTARKFENEEDPKGALKVYLESRLAATAKTPEEKQATTKKAAPKKATKATPKKSQASAPPPTEADTEGLI